MAKLCKKCNEWKPYSYYFDDRFRMCVDCYDSFKIILK